MEIYVQSAGFDQEQDYRWTHSTPDGLAIDSCPRITLATECVNTGEQSIVLLRNGGRLLLLINDLRSSRCDFNGRRISNAVAWVGEDKDEMVLRELAARRLDEWWQDRDPLTAMEQTVDGAIQGLESLPPEQVKEGERRCGFGVNGKALEQLTRDSKQASAKALPSELAEPIVGSNNPETRQKLAEILKQYRLPRRDGPLVVVARFTRRELLRQKNVWYGLTELEDQAPRPFPKKSRTTQAVLWTVLCVLFAVCLLGVAKSWWKNTHGSEKSRNASEESDKEDRKGRAAKPARSTKSKIDGPKKKVEGTPGSR